MGTPNRSSIATNLLTTLEGITIANGYNTDIIKAEGVLRAWDDPLKKPWIGFLLGLTPFGYQKGDRIRATMSLTIASHIAVPGAVAKSLALSNLDDDIIAAVNLDTTRGGFAVSSTILSSWSDDGDPDSDDQSEPGSGTVIQEWEIVYYRTSGQS